MKLIAHSLMLTTALISAFHLADAQQGPPNKVSGQVIQTGAKPVEFATVTLLKAKDSSLVKGAVADISGHYEFDRVQQGRYLIAANFIGLSKAYSKPFDVKNGTVQVDALTLSADAKNLKAVDVTAKKPYIEQKADKLVVNVENSIVAAGGTAMEVLEKSPGVTVDKDDNISLKGKNGVMIMIDGKLTNMSSQDVAQLLKNMPSSNIEQIELIANPSAKYDAAGNAGIINIKLKKNKNFGTNGNVTLGYAIGKTPKYSGSVNLNHRTEKFNIYGSYNYGDRRNRQVLGLYRTSNVNGKTSIFDQENNMDTRDVYNGVKVGTDYFINKRHTIGVMVDANYRDRKQPSNTVNKIGTFAGIDSLLRTNTDNKSDWNRWAYNINYKGILDSSGKEINVDLDYARNNQTQLSNIYATSWDATGKGYKGGDTSRNDQPSSITIKTARIDYTHPLKNQAKFEAGLKTSFVETDNDARFDSLRNNNWVFDTNRSNHFIYKENINAAYINYSKQFKKFGVQLGLRGEQSNVKGNSITTNKVTDTTYFNLFPSVFLSYTADKNNQLGVSYSRRIRRPSYEDLNPFEFYLDRYTKIAGNPYLKPQYSDNIELTHTFKQFLITSIGYTHTQNMIAQIVEADKDAATGDTLLLRYKYLNIAKSDIINLNVSIPFPITKWWNTFTNLSLNHAMYNTVVDNNLVDVSATGFFGRTQHTFTLPKGFAVEASFFYVSPQIADEGLFRMKAMYACDLGLQKQILKKKATIRVNVNDVFNNQRFRGSFDNAGRYVAVSSKWESRQLRVNFTYRFGNTNVKAARNRKTGLEDEQNRVKQGS